MRPAGATSWSTQQLTELLALVSSLPDDADVLQRGLEHAAESLESDVGAVVADGAVVASRGFAMGAVPDKELLGAAARIITDLDVPGAHRLAVLVVDFEDLPGGRLLLGRQSPVAYDSEERSLLQGFARVLSLALQARRTLQQERHQRVASERDARHRQRLLLSLRERQRLLERLARIQRSISTRRPLQDVLDAIVAGASELTGDEIAGLRLIDPVDSGMLVLVASTGVPPQVREAARRSPIGAGAGGLAVSRRALVHGDDYAKGHQPLDAFLVDGVRSSMAAPIFQGDDVVASLVVATRHPGRRYSKSEREVLLAFAEHTGLALNDARSAMALQEAASDATRQARRDPLTGLPNRTHFLEGLQSARSEGTSVGLLFIDLDNFKLVNDTLGHPVGDALLRVVGERISGSVRGDDMVARLGGDEFAVLLRTTPPEQAELTAQRIRQAMNQPFGLSGHVVSIGASTGVVLSTTSRGTSAEELLRDADVAMYQAKALGKGRAVLFAPSMRVDLQARSRLERDLRTAIDCAQLVAHYQPIIDVVHGRVVGSEALLRWRHPELGLVSPADFISVAEDTGMIVPMGLQVLVDATTQTAEWNKRRSMPLGVSVNVSARQLTDGAIVGHVREALARSGLPGSCLTLELTESMLVDDMVAADGILIELKSLGVHLAIDDFGTGYSSLSYLARLPVDILKIDKSFLSDTRDTSHARVAASVVALARSLDLKTVVEGVETVDQLGVMHRLGCRLFQGYLWSPAVEVSTFPAVVARLEVMSPLPSPKS